MNKIGKGLISIGIIIILIPILGSLLVTYRQKQLYDEYKQKWDIEKIQKEQAASNVKQQEETEKPTILVDEWMPPHSVEQGETIGKITIDRIDLELLLIEGVDDGALGLGAGHMPDTALPGQSGNCVIAGHRNYTFGSMFNRLDEIAEGDSIIVELQGKRFTYTVTEVKIVDPDDLSVTKQDNSLREITLITCHPVYSSAHRLIIKGELAE